MNAAGATLVYDRRTARRRGAIREPPRLVVTAGPLQGQEHTLAAERTSIGRSSGNVLVIADLSVSRRHSRVEKQGGRWMVLDQGSGNGTRVNGRKIQQHALEHGDEIGIGDTRLRFLEPGGVLVKGAAASCPPRPLPAAPVSPVAGGSRARFAAGNTGRLWGAILAATIFVPGAALVHRQRQLDAQGAAQDDESRAFARKRFQEGVALLKAGRWEAARTKLRIAAELDGRDEEIARYVRSVEDEAPRAAQLEMAREALARRDYASARGALAGIPDDSALAESGQELSRQLRDALAAQAAIPGRRRAAPVRRPVPLPPLRDAPAPENLDGILEAYLSGDVDAGVQRAQAAPGPGAALLLSQLKAFETAYRDGVAKQQAGHDAEALRALEQARAVDLGIARGRTSRVGSALRKALSALHYRLAAAQPEDDGALPAAAAHLFKAVDDDPENTAAQALLLRLEDRCKEIYLRAYVRKEEDPAAARKAFALVAQALPASYATAQKARRWLEKLDGKAPGEE